MAHYLLIDSRDPYESRDVERLCQLAKRLIDEGNTVTVYLVQNAVLGARRASRAEHLEEAALAGAAILADEFSLRERGIGKERLAPVVAPAPLEAVIETLEKGAKALWH
jgi:hypothetical protein